ncbi:MULTISPECIES: putative quinol monooxygenase [Vibrio]|uniref:putative quinol monooxygenase n=1 Tax=Vibrio TaxID=662 RepID=UPI0020758190|nr:MULTISPECIES: putative quinol monooxygenase [Vibrio]USD35101.1 antibiotic biosynthesis monooxygenase [Vibrio sp. SCSIO 43186]USD48167.1 antibiotic biosynthesis monooxygenase [Vibrio sp. SCSIO 43145]USD72226.1 antibiotic biosynthesis monooxygenase [Vibrio sp. SCSIO 43139]USD97900.1 antibiotic biosynthesis monooxygenase [Vibrio coralliilyticus]
MYCIIVSNRVKKGREENYITIMNENAKASCQNELGCVQFDVIRDLNDPQLFHLYEIYQSQEALTEHKQTEHYLASRVQLADIVVEQSVIRADVVATNSK